MATVIAVEATALAVVSADLPSSGLLAARPAGVSLRLFVWLGVRPSLLMMLRVWAVVLPVEEVGSSALTAVGV